MTTKVLVTGCSGYVGSHVVDQLLKGGFAVRGSVRRPGGSEELVKAVVGADGKTFEECEANLLQDGGWDEACKGVRFVCHVASPFPLAQQGKRSVAGLLSSFYRVNEEEFEHIIKPAIEGTRRVLSAAAQSSSVERVVVTSSVAAVVGSLSVTKNDGSDFDESDWTPLGHAAQSEKVDAYSRSKALAEKVAWLFATKAPISREEIMGTLFPSKEDAHGNDVVETWLREQVNAIDALHESGMRKIEVVTVNPSYVMGPMFLKRHCEDSTSSGVVKRILTMGMRAAPKLSITCCDVRDVAEAHVAAMLSDTASGERYIVNADTLWLLEMGDALREKYGSNRFVLPRITAPYFAVYLMSLFDSEIAAMLPSMYLKQLICGNKSKDALLAKKEYIPVKDSIVSLAESLIHHGIVA